MASNTHDCRAMAAEKSALGSFDRLTTNGCAPFPFAVSRSNHRCRGGVEHLNGHGWYSKCLLDAYPDWYYCLIGDFPDIPERSRATMSKRAFRTSMKTTQI